jgi:hypothetical protein
MLPIILLCLLEVVRLITKVAALEICTKENLYCIMIKLNLPSPKNFFRLPFFIFSQSESFLSSLDFMENLTKDLTLLKASQWSLSKLPYFA